MRLVSTSFPAVFLLYPCCKVPFHLYPSTDAHGLPYHHRNDGLHRKPCRCERRRGLRHGQTGTRPYPGRRTSPLKGNGQVPLFVCPAVRPFLLASLACYSPLIFRFAPTVLDQHIFPCHNCISPFLPIHLDWCIPPIDALTGYFAAK